MNQSSSLFCFGFGYTAQHFARHLMPKGYAITGTTRSEDKIEAWRERGGTLYPFPSDSYDEMLEALRGCDVVLVSIPPDAQGDPVYRALKDELIKLDISWLGYLSTTGVYGDAQGAWVDEESELRPFDARTKQRCLAESQWLSLKANIPVHLFRLAGIYGPQRNALERVKAGKARRIIKPDLFFSRIHVTDIVSLLAASLENPAAGDIFNACDDLPCEASKVIEYACDLLDMPYPEAEDFEQADLSDMMRSFYAANRKVSNRRAKEKLGLNLAYPSYEEGLRALLNELSD